MTTIPIPDFQARDIATEAPLRKGARVRVARTNNGEHPELVGGTYPIVCRFENVPQLRAQGLSGREYRIQYGERCLSIAAEYLEPEPARRTR